MRSLMACLPRQRGSRRSGCTKIWHAAPATQADLLTAVMKAGQPDLRLLAGVVRPDLRDGLVGTLLG
jgi:hypothetical protein